MASCTATANLAFTKWAVDSGLMKDFKPAGGFIHGFCHYDAALDAQITLSSTGPASPCTEDPTLLCRKWDVSIPQNRPLMDTYIYLPSKTYLHSLWNCADESASIDRYYDDVLQHEMAHEDIYDNADVMMDAKVMRDITASDNVDPTEIKMVAYERWCKINFVRKIKALQDAFDKEHEYDPEVPLSDSCARCDSRSRQKNPVSVRA
jgi:hypothetical protein